MSRLPTTEPVENVPPGFTDGPYTYSFIRGLDVRGPSTLFLARRCHQQERIPELVILKRPNDSQNREARLRLLEEGRLGLTLNHPALARVLGVAVHAGTPHLVMEYVEGLTLERVLNKAARRHQPLSPPFAAYVAAELADALHHAHTLTGARGEALQLVHRDVSPRNILVGANGAVKLSDFGAAYTVASGRPRTQGPVLKGAVDYSAPEVLRLEPPDARADLFSLGLVLLELLTLQHLYNLPEQSTQVPLAGFAMPQGGLRSEEPSWIELEELAATASHLLLEDVERMTVHVPAPLRQIVLRALRAHPAERHATAAAMRDELRGYLAMLDEPYGPEALLLELRQVLSMAARVHGEVQTSRDPLPAALKGQLPVRH
jgi:serine/threonine protein kinase